MFNIPVLIIGGGVIGLNIAYAISKSNFFSCDEIVLCEKDKFLGEHSSSRNSGVLHAGLYYPYNSLKHKLCMEGRLRWQELSVELNIPVNMCGKYIIARSETESLKLDELYNRGLQNGVRLIHDDYISFEDKEELKEVVNFKKIFFSPDTSIIDVGNALKILETTVYNQNITIMKESEVKVIGVDGNSSKFIVQLGEDEVSCDVLINTGGLGAVTLRNSIIKDGPNVENHFIKGSYLKLNKKFPYVKSLLYPMPNEKMNVLGVHSCIDFSCDVRFGPNSSDIGDDVENMSNIYHSLDHEIISDIYPSISEIFKDIDKSELSYDYSGIRSKIKVDKELYKDFWIKGPLDHGVVGYYELLGIDSPGLTAAPAIANHILNLIRKSSKGASKGVTFCL